LISDLKMINKIQGPFALERKAYDMFAPWYEAQDKAPPIIPGTVFTGYNERRPMYWLKLGMLMSASRSAKRIITLQDLVAANQILSRTEAVMPRVFDQFGQTPLARVAREVFEELKVKGSLTLNDISRKLMDYMQIKSVCNALSNRSDVLVERGTSGEQNAITYVYRGRRKKDAGP